MEELKPCPFCGEKATISKGKSMGIFWHSAHCNNLDCTGHVTAEFSFKQEAIEAWNKRK